MNSFGFGGTNAHVVLDDAYHYLRGKGLAGNHCTVHSCVAMEYPLTTCNAILPNVNTHGITTPTLMVPAAEEAVELFAHREAPLATMIGPNCINGICSNGTQQENATIPSCKSSLRLLVLTAPDERSLGRVVQGYSSYHKLMISGNVAMLDRLTYTLATRRTHMRWRTYAVVNANGLEENQGQSELITAKPSRSSEETGLLFVFTGQGAQYINMGIGLVQYPVFKETLCKVQEVYRSLGCEWLILGRFLAPTKRD